MDREPTMEEMATRMGVDVRYIKQYESLLVDTISLNTLINDENNTELEYFVPSDNNVEDQVIRASLRKQLLISFDNADLSDRLKDIIMLRFVLIDGRCWNLAEVSQKYNITH